MKNGLNANQIKQVEDLFVQMNLIQTDYYSKKLTSQFYRMYKSKQEQRRKLEV